jgi:molybdopterin converting factor small subunit
MGAAGVPGSSEEVPVHLFGPLSDCAASPVTVAITLPVQVAQLRAVILDVHPDFRAVTFRIAVDGRSRTDSEIIEEASEVALLPPFAGG